MGVAGFVLTGWTSGTAGALSISGPGTSTDDIWHGGYERDSVAKRAE